VVIRNLHSQLGKTLAAAQRSAQGQSLVKVLPSDALRFDTTVRGGKLSA